eukprot:jgi/Chrzof1/13463/UNPLg00546.t1
MIDILEAANLKGTAYPKLTSFAELSKALTSEYPPEFAGQQHLGIITGDDYITAKFTYNSTAKGMKPLDEPGSLVVDTSGQVGRYDDIIATGAYVLEPSRPIDAGSSAAGAGVSRNAEVRLYIPFTVYGPPDSLTVALDRKR